MEKDHKQRGRQKLLQGRVTSDKMDKTCVILVEKLEMHPMFKKLRRLGKKTQVHDEKNEARSGDLISAIGTRPISRHKRHRLFRILERAK